MPEITSKKDTKFFHTVSLNDACANLPYLRNLAERDYPSLTYCDIVVCINFAVFPPTFTLKPLDGYETATPQGCTPSAGRKRHTSIAARVQENREKYTLIESMMSCGERINTVLTMVTGKFWMSDAGARDSGSLAVDEDED